MGRNELIDVKEAAEILEVSSTRVNQLIRTGSLRCYYPHGRRLNKPRALNRLEVEAYKRARNEEVTPTQAYRKAVVAEARTATLEKRLENIEYWLGIQTVDLPTDLAGIAELLVRVDDVLKNPPKDAEAIFSWGRILLGIHEEFLELIERHTGHPKPWAPFFELARVVRENTPNAGDEDELQLRQAHAYFNSASRALRQSAFFYIDGRSGRRAANREVPGLDFHERVLRHIPR